MNGQVQDTIGGDRGKQGVDYIAGQHPREPASVISTREETPFELGPVSEESQVEPRIDLAWWWKEGIVLVPSDNQRQQEHRQEIRIEPWPGG
jgi:hypothetical protein